MEKVYVTYSKDKETHLRFLEHFTADGWKVVFTAKDILWTTCLSKDV